MVEDKKESNSLSKEELDQIQKDIDDAKNAVNKDALSDAKAKGKKEAKKEFEHEAELKKSKEEITKLTEQLKTQQKTADEQFNLLKDKVNSLAESKAVVNMKDPFDNNVDNSINKPKNPENWSDEQVREYEENSAKAFFGEEAYENMKRQMIKY